MDHILLRGDVVYIFLICFLWMFYSVWQGPLVMILSFKKLHYFGSQSFQVWQRARLSIFLREKKSLSPNYQGCGIKTWRACQELHVYGIFTWNRRKNLVPLVKCPIRCNYWPANEPCIVCDTIPNTPEHGQFITWVTTTGTPKPFDILLPRKIHSLHSPFFQHDVFID